MLYCNDELVSLKDETWKKRLEPEFNKIQRMKNPIRIITTQQREINRTGRAEPFPHHSWPLIASVISEEGQTETWRYCKYAPAVKDGEKVFTERSIMIQHGDISIDPIKQTELAYFLLKLSGLTQSGLFKVEDIDGDNTKVVEKLGENAILEFFLCSKHSPIFNNPRKLKQLAASWGVANSDIMHIDTLRKSLLDKVSSSHRNYAITKRGVEEFVAEVNGSDPFTEFRETIQKAKDLRIIGWSDKNRGWFFTDASTGEFVEPIVFVPATQMSQKDNFLFENIRISAVLNDTLKKAVATAYEENPGLANSSAYDDMKWGDLLKEANDKGVKTFGMKREEIVARLLLAPETKL